MFGTFNSSKGKEPCSFFLRGNCRFGTACRNSHDVNQGATGNNTFGGPIFGQSPSTPLGSSPFGGFGQGNASSGFGGTQAPSSPFVFGASSSNPASGSLGGTAGSSAFGGTGGAFGGTGGAFGGSFGAAPFSGGGAFGGFGDAAFKPTPTVDGDSTFQLHNITAMPNYANKQVEELRYEDHLKRKGQGALPPTNPTGSIFGGSASAGTGAFGAAPATSLFNSTNAPFGSSSTTAPFGSSSTTAPFGSSSTTAPFGSSSTTATFGSSSATAPFGSTAPFGTASGSTAPFGTTGGAAPFGSTASATAPFGTATSNTLFGANSTTTPFGSSTASTAPFGATNNTLFGNNSTTAPFGSAAASTAPFGTTGSTTPFGSTSNTTAPLFGSATPAFGSSATATPGSLFGTNPSSSLGSSGQTPFGSSGGGSSAPFGQTGNLFGGGAAFGSATNSFAPSGGQGGNPFGSSQPTSSFGTGQPSLFSAPSTSFGAQPKTQTGGLFSSPQTPFPSSFGQTGGTQPFSAGGTLFGATPSLFSPAPSFLTGNSSQPALTTSISSAPYGPVPVMPVERRGPAGIPGPARAPPPPLSHKAIPKGARTRPRGHGASPSDLFQADEGQQESLFAPKNDLKRLVIESEAPQGAAPLTAMYLTESNTPQPRAEAPKADPPTPLHRPIAQRKTPRSQPAGGSGPKLTKEGYYTDPPLEQLGAGDMSAVPDFKVGRTGVGSVLFPGKTDVRGLNLDAIIEFHFGEVILYPKESQKPSVGGELNKEAIVTLEKVWPMDKATKTPKTDPQSLRRYEQTIRKTTRKIGAEFIAYNSSLGLWIFKVDHF